MRNNGWHDGRFGKMSMLSAWMNGRRGQKSETELACRYRPVKGLGITCTL
ncbi:hypothetical protein ACLK19_03550 [Escherichia coli]